MLSVDQCSITIMMAILIALMKLSSKYTEKSEVKLYMISTVFPHKEAIILKDQETNIIENAVLSKILHQLLLIQ